MQTIKPMAGFLLTAAMALPGLQADWSCASCHTAAPANHGKHGKTGKDIAPMAPR